ncbi:MAG: hypothetical protein Q9219_005876 [cf. Caloplaca sp. 3 TL-2023]
MDFLQDLEGLAIGATQAEQEPTPDDISLWHRLFGYSASEARNIIMKLRENLSRRRLSLEQWSMIKEEQEAQGHNRETYEHQLYLWSTSSHRQSRPQAPLQTNEHTYWIFKLGGPFEDVKSLQQTVGISAEARTGQSEDGETARFARVDNASKRSVEEWFASRQVAYYPTFVRLSLSPKNLSDVSSYPALGIDSSLPQHRLHHANERFSPTQTEYPVWYFFYGTLMDPETLQKCIGLPLPPKMISASVRGGVLKSWRRKYKALVDGPENATVEGFAHLVESAEQEEYLRFRETVALFHAAFAQFCYTGAQIAIAGYFINYAVEVRTGTSSATGAIYLAVAQGCFAVGRFSGSFLMRFIKPRWVFLAYLSCVIIFNAAATTQKQATGIAMLSLTLFFESVCFPTIVALGIRGIGKHTKRGSGLIVAGVSGGAAVPPILGAAADATSTATAMVVPVCFMVAAWTYALAVNFVASYRDPADKIGAATIGIENERQGSEAREESGRSEEREESEEREDDAGKGTEVRTENVV